MKRWVEIAVACAACAACAGDLTFPDAANGVVEMTGEGKDEIVHSRSEPVTVKTCGVYGFVYMGRKLGHGTMLAGNKDVNVDRYCPDASWYEYRQAYLTEGLPGGTARDVFHYGHYRGLGGFAFKEGRVCELKPVYAAFDGGLVLGHGESLNGNDYRFDGSYACLARNHARPLHHYRRTVFNTDHWNVSPTSEIVYAHELAGRRLLSGTVAFTVSYSSGTGPVLVSASRDGESWLPLGAATNKCDVSLDVPAALFPASRLFVRFVGGPRAALQISHYGFDGAVDGPPLKAFGSTRYLAAGTGELFGAVEAPVFAAAISPANAHLLPSPSSAAVWSVVEDVKVFRSTPVPTATAGRFRFRWPATRPRACSWWSRRRPMRATCAWRRATSSAAKARARSACRPDLKVLLYASFPTRLTWRNLRNRAANVRYAALADGRHVIFRDINDRLSPALFPDGVHPNGKARDFWLADLAACLP